MSEQIHLLLEKLGFTKKEAEIYLAIQQQGKATATYLAEITGINRTTVYSVTHELLAKRVIREDFGSQKRELLALPPEKLLALLESQKKAIQEQEKRAEEAIELIKTSTKNAAYPVPKIQFIKGEDIESFLKKRTKTWNKSLLEQGGEWLGFQESSFVGKFEDWIDWYWAGAPQGISLQLITSDRHEAEKRVAGKGYDRRKIVFWENQLPFTATTWVMGDYVVMLSLSSEPHYLVEIHDARMAENQRALFHGILQEIKE